VCQDPANQLSGYCNAVQPNSTFSTLTKCGNHCGKGKEPNQGCHCVYPLTGVFTLRSPSFSGFSNNSNFLKFGESLMTFFKNGKYPVDSVAMRNISENPTDYHLLINLLIFPSGRDRFNQTEMDSINSAFTIQDYKPPPRFGPYIFVADQYKTFSGMMKRNTHSNEIYIDLTHFTYKPCLFHRFRRFQDSKYESYNWSSSWCCSSSVAVGFSWDLRS